MEAVEEPLPEKRIGDRERREVDERLRQAHADGVLTLTEYDERSGQCWSARTRRELDVLTSDLPEPVAEPAPPSSPAVPAEAAPKPEGSGSGWLKFFVGLAVLGVVGSTAGQAVTADDGLAVFGSRVVQVGADQDRIEVGALFGSVEVVVPDDVRVRTSGRQIFGGTNCEAACDGTGVREVVVDSSGAFGSVDVVRQSERGADRDGDRDRDGDSDGADDD